MMYSIRFYLHNFWHIIILKLKFITFMGALTLKSFPFILRDWDVKSYDSIDPTDSFGQDTNIYINKNQIIKIEPQFSNINSTIWLTDKEDASYPS